MHSRFPATGAEVSRLGFGGAAMGLTNYLGRYDAAASRDHSLAAVRRAVAAGIDLFRHRAGLRQAACRKRSWAKRWKACRRGAGDQGAGRRGRERARLAGGQPAPAAPVAGRPAADPRQQLRWRTAGRAARQGRHGGPAGPAARRGAGPRPSASPRRTTTAASTTSWIPARSTRCRSRTTSCCSIPTSRRARSAACSRPRSTACSRSPCAPSRRAFSRSGYDWPTRPTTFDYTAALIQFVLSNPLIDVALVGMRTPSDVASCVAEWRATDRRIDVAALWCRYVEPPTGP